MYYLKCKYKNDDVYLCDPWNISLIHVVCTMHTLTETGQYNNNVRCPSVISNKSDMSLSSADEGCEYRHKDLDNMLGMSVCGF